MAITKVMKIGESARVYGDYKPVTARCLPEKMHKPPESLHWMYQINVADELKRSGLPATVYNGQVIACGRIAYIPSAKILDGQVWATGWDIMVYINSNFPSVVNFPPPTKAEKKSIMEKVNRQVQIAGKKYGIDPYLLKAIIAQESSFNPRAVSPSKAEGLMQLMPQLIRDYKVQDSFDIIQNIDAGARYFKKSMLAFPDNLNYAIASYNCGIEPLKMSIAFGEGLRDLDKERHRARRIAKSKETRDYVPLVKKYYNQFKAEGNLTGEEFILINPLHFRV